MAGSLQTNVRFSTEYWMRLAVIAMFGWTTTAEPLVAQTPPAPDPAQQAPGAAAPAPADQAADVYSMTDLEYLLGPIALYPDPLLALILPASTHPDQIIEAARWLENNPAAVARNDFTEVDAKPWDPSVQALTRFPDTVKMLADHPDWTESLGWAFSVQDADVAAVIQMLRAKAESAGNLKSTPEQVVTTREEGGSRVIYIAPTNPERIYVPVYDSSVVFDTVVTGALVFGTAVLVGSAWNNRWGWNNRNWNQVWIRPPGPGWRPPVRPIRPPPGAWRPGGPGRPPAFVRIGPAYVLRANVPIVPVQACGLTARAFGLTGQRFPATGRTAPARVPTVPARVLTVPRFDRIVRLPGRNVQPRVRSVPPSRSATVTARSPATTTTCIPPKRPALATAVTTEPTATAPAGTAASQPSERAASSGQSIQTAGGGTAAGATPAPARRTQPTAMNRQRHLLAASVGASRCRNRRRCHGAVRRTFVQYPADGIKRHRPRSEKCQERN